MKRSDRLMARLATLRAVSRALARPLDVPDVLRAVYAELSPALDVTICFFGRYDAPGQVVEVIWQVHNGDELPGGHFPLGDGPTLSQPGGRKPNSACKSPQSHFTNQSFSIKDASAVASASA